MGAFVPLPMYHMRGGAVGSLLVRLARGRGFESRPRYKATKHTTMKVLTLIIKQGYFDQILAGEKHTETREIRPKTAGKYIYYENADTGRRYAPKNIDSAPESKNGYRYGAIEYDAIQFYVGYNSNRPGALVAVSYTHLTLPTN